RSLRVYSQLFGVPNSAYKAELIRSVDSYQIDCILAYWGTNPIADILTIKKARPKVKVLLNVLCHPTGLSASKVAAQNWLLRRSLRYCDGLILSSRAMQSYFSKEILRQRPVKTLVLPPYLSEHYRPRDRLPPCRDEPNLLFLGRTDWSAGQQTDNVRSILQEILDHGFHLYHSRTKESVQPHACRHVFASKPLSELGSFVTQFDASLVVYNLDGCARDDRFRVTIPDRLLASVAFGIPIAIPKKGYQACKEFLCDYGAVIEYGSVAELFDRLSDRADVRRLRSVAEANSNNYVGERHSSRLREFIALVLAG
ncbi:MAG TPA: hypothetical protein VKE94_18385, partial [Gemmataceae bacterium]|nr:hypothetical protein [Gemmataceae bacterium]